MTLTPNSKDSQKRQKQFSQQVKTEAEGVKLLRNALEGEGGRNLVRLEYAKRLKQPLSEARLLSDKALRHLKVYSGLSILKMRQRLIICSRNRQMLHWSVR